MDPIKLFGVFLGNERRGVSPCSMFREGGVGWPGGYLAPMPDHGANPHNLRV